MSAVFGNLVTNGSATPAMIGDGAQVRRGPADYPDVNLRKLRDEAGFTVIEVLVAATVLIVGVGAALSLIDRANSVTVTTKSREGATSLARELVESVRAVQYDRLAPTTLLNELAAQPGLADSVPGGAYTLMRRGVTYEVTGSVCAMDDSRDGGGVKTGGTFCAGSASVSTPADETPEDYKRASLTVSWTRSGSKRSVTQAALINNPGAAGAPYIRSITAPASPITTNPVALNFKTNNPAASVNWMVDGSIQSPAPTALSTARTDWSVAWDVSQVVDGPYVIGAEAFDEYGVAGPTRQLTITLNRNKPFQPTGATGGRNRFGHVEIEWTANPERDIVGYEVRRGSVVVCSLATLKTATECLDTAPPDVKDGDQTYTVYAYDRDGTLDRPGPGADVKVIANNEAPEAPVNVQRGFNGVTLTWSRPSPADTGPSDDTIAFYRIYRDGRAYGDRYARWYSGEATVSWTDPDPGAGGHTYWVTSVDTNRLESSFTGGVPG